MKRALDRRAAGFAALLAGLAVYYAGSDRLWDASTWWDVAWLALVIIPAVFGLVWFLLPFRQAKALPLFAIGSPCSALRSRLPTSARSRTSQSC